MGNTLQESNDQQHGYGYNAQNRISEYTKDGKLKARYHYNALGQRIHKAVIKSDGSEQHTLFHYGQQGELLGETQLGGLNNSNQQHAQNIVWLQTRPIVAIDTPQNEAAHIAWLHSDHLLTARAATNANQNIIWRWLSDAFGVGETESLAQANQAGLTLNLRFPGQYHDEESGLHYNYFRAYDPSKGRYTQSDPIGLGGGMNTYGYVFGNPISMLDFLGTDAIYIKYDNYPINTEVNNPFTGNPIYVNAYHAAVVTVDPLTGRTRYYEYGRYDKENKGVVRRMSIPDLVFVNGSPTPDSLERLYAHLSKNLGRDSDVIATYHADADHNLVNAYAEQVMRDPNRADYSLISNNCGTFADSAIAAGKNR